MSAPLSQEKATDLLRAVEGVLAEFGVKWPGALSEGPNLNAPACYLDAHACCLLDHLYDRWSACLNEIHGISVSSSGSWEPDPLELKQGGAA